MNSGAEYGRADVIQGLSERAWLAAIVESSDDAIVGKTLQGVILSWNGAAERLFGYSAEEAIGRHISLIIPEDRLDEESEILSRLSQGKSIRHFETLRRHKDGSLVDISLTVSPVCDEEGRVVGASKIARDIRDARRHAEQQALLLREMGHRIKNLFAVISGLLSLSARDAGDVDDLVHNFAGRVAALDRAHALTMPDSGADPVAAAVDVRELLATIVAPYERRGAECRFVVDTDILAGARSLPMLALIVHELATNAAKYGALSHADGRLAVSLKHVEGEIWLDWVEAGCPAGKPGEMQEGFGSLLLRTAARSLGGQITRRWTQDGLVAQLRLPSATFAQ